MRWHFSHYGNSAVATGKTTPDGRRLFSFLDDNGNRVTAYQGADGRWYNPKKYSPEYKIPENVTSKTLKTSEMLGANGTRLDSTTVWKEQGSKARIDVENPNPGQRAGQVHYQDANNAKYYYDPKKQIFYVNNSEQVAPKAIQNLLNDPKFKRGIDKALQYLGEK